MIRRSYEIKGFDCAHCAAKTETYLNKHEAIESCTIDFVSDRLHIVFKDNELTVQELLDVIKEVEEDPITLSLLGEKKPKTYYIKGFDCAHCAAKAENHLNKNEAIDSCTIDFAADKLYVTYKSKNLSPEELKNIIKEVEEDEIEIKELDKKVAKTRIFDKKMWIKLARIIASALLVAFAMIFFKTDEYYWYSFAFHIVAVILVTYDVVWRVIKNIINLRNPIDESLLITLSSVGAFIIATISKENNIFMDAVMVALLYQVGEIIKGVATNKSKQAISAAIDLRVEVAHKLVNGSVIEVAPEDLMVGDEVIVTTGELIPIDATILDGEGLIDTSSLTGEFMPIPAIKNNEVYSGCLLKSGTLTLKVNKEYKDSTISKINDLISNSGAKKSRADEFVSKFARWYTPIVFAVSVLTGIIGGLITNEWQEWIILGLKMMVVACPCAIVISVPLAYFSGLGLASKHGIVIKGTNYLEKLVGMKKLITDKTGTLTEGKFEIVKVSPTGEEKELLEALYAAEYLSKHPIGKAICKDVDVDELSKKCKKFNEIPGFGVSILLDNKEVYAGSEKLMNKHGVEVNHVSEDGVVIHVIKDNKYLGYVILSDLVKADAKDMIDDLNKMGIESILLTGDKERNAKALCERLGITRYESELLPEDKISYLEKELGKGQVTGFLGDGVNDAASIKEADIGFAMGGVGSDIAVENADIVIMTDHPSKVVEAIKIAKSARRTSVFNLVAAISIKFAIELLAFITNLLGHPEFVPMWLAVLADTGLTVLLVLNSLLVLYRKIPSKVVK